MTRTVKRIPCLLHEFYKPAPEYKKITVLNYYIVNGTFTANESDFSGISGRSPNIRGNPARYVAQLQITAASKQTVKKAASDFTELISGFFPDESGKVRVAE